MPDRLQQHYLTSMGITVWQSKPTPVTVPAQAHAHLSHWVELARTVAACRACDLCHNRKQTVFGIGNQQADLLLVGEAPGAQEDLKGEPFVGRAGQLLDRMLQAIGLSRSQIYIANILKCRPPHNRDPTADEVQRCTPFLLQQIALLQPKLIVALGRVSAHYLLSTSATISSLRKEWFRYGEGQIPLRVTYHPAYLLRNPEDKRRAWEDLCVIQKYLAQQL